MSLDWRPPLEARGRRPDRSALKINGFANRLDGWGAGHRELATRIGHPHQRQTPTKELHVAAATLQARFRGRRCLPPNAAGAAGASGVPKKKHGVAATLHASKLHVPRLHLRLPAALGGRRPVCSKRPVGASEGGGKAATRAALL